ncbi:hypothetical protein DERF_004857 [Dermatophagoides farinae]|uniref:Uncharacterized protein n=1 Tax=Dermatophagoides farinae TaxID=6954 RepID=A0A922L600_DERFA|nr:hypothetical protein DERF_004857 [Dermatophagoides farinae]
MLFYIRFSVRVFGIWSVCAQRQSIISFENYKAFFPLFSCVYGMSKTNTNNITYPLWIQFFTLKQQQQQQQTKTKTLK